MKEDYRDYDEGDGKAVGYALGVTLSILIAVLIGVTILLFSSCKSQKTVTAIDHSSSTAYTDTTRTVSDAMIRKSEAVDTTKTAASYESAGMIEFVDGGGTVRIDTAGNVTFEGVKNFKGKQTGNVARNNGINLNIEEAAVRQEQINGVETKQDVKIKHTEEKEPKPKWHETMFARIGQGVFIAAILWLLFLYLRRKKK